MNIDWKDSLSSLRDSFAPSPEEPDACEDINFKDSDSDKNIQKEPLHVVTERKGRNGKTATIVEGFLIDEKEIESIAKELKQRLGTGGSSRGSEILIQGERKAEVTEFLRKKGFKVK